ncbi:MULTISPECIES: YagK/YfjJ domain-containing protein [unclassified Pseudomonas]|uniref:YagK/YfjJ domain-containing protein n=1 Tax=unclassified Pseudomonas TaxID=196821 RepID=UPI001EF150F6|nr:MULTISPECIES: inovirus-type Gp2 protein [unclassified Pseudomonas]
MRYDLTNRTYRHDPFIQTQTHLEKLCQTLQYALSDYARVFAFRFDLRLPCGKPLPDDAMTNQVIQRFKASLDAQFSHDRERARIRNRSSHDTCVRLFWVREVGRACRPHYHCIVFLNRDTECFFSICSNVRDTLFVGIRLGNRIE